MSDTAYAYNQVVFQYGSIEDAFPDVDANLEPFGSRVLVQLRRAKSKTRGGIILVEETKEAEKWNEQVAKVLKVGPLAFHNRNTRDPWPEGAWCVPGDFIRVSKYGGDRWSVTYGDKDDNEEIVFVLFNDLDLLGGIANPLAMKSFI